MTILALLLVLGAVVFFVAHGAGWPRGLGFGLACATAAVLLLPALSPWT